MTIHTLKLTHFKQHKQAEHTLPAGLVSVTGPNGVGKSNMLKGILYPLFGVDITGASAHLANRETGGTPEAVITIDLPKHGRCTVTRSPKKALVEGPDGGKPLASGQTPVTAFIAEAYGVDSKMLRTLLYSPQGESQGLLTMGATGLQKKVEEIAQVDIVDKVLDLVSKDLTGMDAQIAAIGGLANPAELQERVNQIAHQLTEYRLILTRDLEPAHTVAVGRKNQLAQQVQRETKAQGERNTLLMSLEGIKGGLAQMIETAAATRRALATNPADLEAAYEAARGVVQQYRTQLRQRAEATEALKRRQAEIAHLQAEIKTLESEAAQQKAAVEQLQDIEPRWQEAAQEASRLQSEYAAAKQRYDSIQRAMKESTCPTCMRPFDGHDPAALAAEVQEAYDTSTQLWGKMKHAVAMEKELQTHKTHLERLVYAASSSEQLVLRKEQLKEARNFAEEHQNFLNSVGLVDADAVTQAENAERIAYTRMTEDTRRRKDLENLDAQIAEGTRKQVEIEAKLLQIPHVDMAELNQQLAEATQAWVAANTDMVNMQNQAASASAELARAEKDMAEAVLREQKVAEMEKRVALLKKFSKYLRDNRQRLTTEAWTSLLSFASGLIESVTSGRLSNLTRENGDFYVTEDGYPMPVSEMSGAQRSIIGLSLRIALTKVFYGGDLPLLLDEPQADMRDDTAAAVTGMLCTLGSQVIMVTHRNDSVLGEVIAL